MIYMVEKTGVYSHGVFYISENADDCMRMAKYFALTDRDGYHEWRVLRYEEQKDAQSYDASHEVVATYWKDPKRGLMGV